MFPHLLRIVRFPVLEIKGGRQGIFGHPHRHCLCQRNPGAQSGAFCPKLENRHTSTRGGGRAALGHAGSHSAGHGVELPPPNPRRRANRAEFQGLPSTPFPQSAREYRQRSLLEKELLFFAYDVFGIPFVDPVSQDAGAGGWGGGAAVWLWGANLQGAEPDMGSVKPVDENQRKAEGVLGSQRWLWLPRLTLPPERRPAMRRVLL